jgi:heterodisulfide reductase subunit A-like polyferredoxin
MSTRRTFLKQLGTLALAATIPTSFIKASNIRKNQNQIKLKDSKIHVENGWDVIVIGGGPGGCTAAISAAREGA